jgi:integrase
MIEEGKSAQTVKNALNVLKPILNTAVKDGAIMVSPAANITSPKIPPSTAARYETAETIIAFASTLDKDSELLVLFSAFTGLRAGECGALRVKDLNLLGGSLMVRESLSEVHGKECFNLPKNNQMRSVALPPFLRDRLVVSLEERKVASDPEALVFVSPKGGLLRHSNFYSRTFKPAIEAFGLKDFRFHDLRHSCAAMLVADGAHPRAIMERFGHSSITVTLDTYGHLLPGLDEALTDGLEEQFQKAVSRDPRPVGGLSQIRQSA